MKQFPFKMEPSEFTDASVATMATGQDEFHLDLAEKLWRVCPPIIITGGTIGKQ